MANIEKRTSSKGEISYRAKVRLKGCPPQSATFSSLSRAKEWARRTEIEIQDGKYLGKIEARKHTIAETLEKYARQKLIRMRPNTINLWRIFFKWWNDNYGAYTLADITPSFLTEAQDRLAQKEVNGRPVTPATINRYMTCMQTVISTACKEWQWLENNPFFRVKKLAEPNGRVRYLSDSERERLLAACQDPAIENPYLYPAVIVAMSTGARKNEILTLRWENIDLNAHRAILQETKNGERRSIPLVGKAYEVVKALYDSRKSDVWVFPSRDGAQAFDITRSWRKALSIAGVDNFHFHDLRHTCASYLAMNGATMGVIAEVLGHKDLKMTKRYAHLSDAHIQGAVESMNRKMFGDAA